ncbi:MAG: hypothetical protein WBP59_12585 [Ilumatobacteraceae bacterium]
MFKHLVNCICNDIASWPLPVLGIAAIHHAARTLRYNVSSLNSTAEPQYIDPQYIDEAHAEE